MDPGRDGFFEGTELFFNFPDDHAFTFDLTLDGQADPILTIDATLANFLLRFQQRSEAAESHTGNERTSPYRGA